MNISHVVNKNIPAYLSDKILSPEGIKTAYAVVSEGIPDVFFDRTGYKRNDFRHIATVAGFDSASYVTGPAGVQAKYRDKIKKHYDAPFVENDNDTDLIIKITNENALSVLWQDAMMQSNLFFNGIDNNIKQIKAIGQYCQECFLQNDWTYCRIPYKSNCHLSIAAVLNEQWTAYDTVTFRTTASNLCENYRQNCVESLLAFESYPVVWFPEINIETNFVMLFTPATLDAFVPGIINNDLSGICNNIIPVQLEHRAKIDINKQGTEATSKTVILLASGYSEIREEPKREIIYIDRRFYFEIEDSDENILYSGVIDNI